MCPLRTIPHRFIAPALCLGALLVAALPAHGQTGNVLISPKRVVLTGRDRGAEVSLVNHGDRAITYRIEWVERSMTPDGTLVERSEPGADAARDLLRYAPRQITVAPGATQKVRLALRKPADLAPGEYRSHLLARALPPATAGTDIETLDQESILSARLTAVPSIAIPVIVRHGPLEAGTDLTRLRLLADRAENTSPVLAFRLHRVGEPSIYGDLTATLIDRDGAQTIVGLAKGIGVYPPLGHVDRRLALHVPDGTVLAGRLRLSFASRPEHDGGGDPLEADAELVLP